MLTKLFWWRDPSVLARPLDTVLSDALQHVPGRWDVEADADGARARSPGWRERTVTLSAWEGEHDSRTWGRLTLVTKIGRRVYDLMAVVVTVAALVLGTWALQRGGRWALFFVFSAAWLATVFVGAALLAWLAGVLADRWEGEAADALLRELGGVVEDD